MGQQLSVVLWVAQQGFPRGTSGQRASGWGEWLWRIRFTGPQQTQLFTGVEHQSSASALPVCPEHCRIQESLGGGVVKEERFSPSLCRQGN